MPSIRIISPSGAIDPTYIDIASERLRSWGYSISEGTYARAREGRFAGTDDQRLSDLVEAFNDPSVDIILCSRGGYGLQRLLPSISEAVFQQSGLSAKRSDSKAVLTGFSDITALHQWCGIHHRPSIHGLMCKHLATLPEDSAPIRYWRQAVEGQTLTYTLPQHPLNRPGTIKGHLCGGNLSVLYGLQATPFSLPNLSPLNGSEASSNLSPILFIEDIAEKHYHIDRMINNLKMSGVLAHIGGLLVGQFSDCENDPSMGCTIYETIRQAVEEYNYPVYFNFPAGHVDEHYTLRFHTPATIEGQHLTILP